MSFLCDTNVFSELVRARPNPGVVTWASQVPMLILSAITVEEVLFGLTRKPNPRVQAMVVDFFATRSRVLAVTEDVARLGGALRGRLQASGRTRSQADMLIAATALAHRLTLVTRNEADFEGAGVPVLNPFA